jgi:hypothetical protein
MLVPKVLILFLIRNSGTVNYPYITLSELRRPLGPLTKKARHSPTALINREQVQGQVFLASICWFADVTDSVSTKGRCSWWCHGRKRTPLPSALSRSTTPERKHQQPSERRDKARPKGDCQAVLRYMYSRYRPQRPNMGLSVARPSSYLWPHGLILNSILLLRAVSAGVLSGCSASAPSPLLVSKAWMLDRHTMGLPAKARVLLPFFLLESDPTWSFFRLHGYYGRPLSLRRGAWS